MKRLYNVAVRTVHLMWAESEDDAITKVVAHLNRQAIDVLPDDRNAFVSEPVPSVGWYGEDAPNAAVEELMKGY